MKIHVTNECSKLNHPEADKFAAEINKLVIE